LKKKILNEDVIKVPFGTGDVRSFNKKKPEDTQPGPGQYIDISKPQYSSVCKPLLKLSQDRNFAEMNGFKIGAFGSNAQRFHKDAAKDTPGPGTYNDAINSVQVKVARATTAPAATD
jgi:Sperm-tail PG-rich repeat